MLSFSFLSLGEVMTFYC